MKRKKCYKENYYMAYIDIWEKYNEATKAKIEARKYYEVEICNDPIKLLKAIKEYALTYKKSGYKMSIILDPPLAFHNY